MTDLEALAAYHADEPIDTTTPRHVSLQEGAKMSRAIYHEMEAKENAARQREADNYIIDLRSDEARLEARLVAAESRLAKLEALIAELQRRLDERTGEL